MARLQFHDQLRVQQLSDIQLNQLSALLSAPAAAPRPSTPTKPFLDLAELVPSNPPPPSLDPLTSLIIEEDLKRQTRANIAHHRTIGTLTGRQHAMGLPVRGQRNKTNAKSAKRLNRIERRGMVTVAAAGERRTLQGSVLASLRTLHTSLGRPSLTGSWN